MSDPRVLLPLLLVVVLTGCVPVGDDGPDPDPGGLCPVSFDLVPGETVVVELDVEGTTRRFRLHVPAGYTGEAPVPLVLAIHGLTMGPIQMANGTELEEKADAEGFAVVFPDGIGASWDAGSCCGGDPTDMAFLRALVDYVRSDSGLCIDRTRVYATGFSNGGFMSYRLACEASDLFAAVAPVAGSLTITKEECQAAIERPVPLLHVHGTGDPIVDYDGSSALSSFSAVDSVADFADIDGCAATTVPALQPESQLDTTCVTYTGCEDGAEVTLCSVDDGGHCWFGSATCGTGVPGGQWFVGNDAEGIVTTDAVWGFLSRFDCPSCGL